MFRGSSSDRDVSKSAIKPSILLFSDGRRDRAGLGPSEPGGLDLELALLCSLYPDASED